MKIVAERLERIRAEMRSQGLDAFLVPRADEHLGEYVPPNAERLAWLTGFTGSAGLAVVMLERAAVFTDGRYTLQLEQQTDGSLFERHHLIEEPPPGWLAAALPGARVGYDPWLMSADTVGRYRDAGLDMVAVEGNPVDVAWLDRPTPPAAQVIPHPLRFAGRSSAEKRDDIASVLRAAKQNAAVITDPASIAWLLNVRGGDVAYTPFALGFLLIRADASVTLFMDRAKIPAETAQWLGNGVAIEQRGALAGALAGLRGQLVRVDEAGSPAWFGQRLRAEGATVVEGTDPCALPKARKNATEQEGARAAHRRDAVAVCRFLRWLDGAAGETTEIGAAERLLGFRAELDGFRGESFPAISGAGEHGAVIHYRVTAESDRPLHRDEVYLVDSGAQFPEGTTDITRTVWTGHGAAPAEVRERATRVMKGHIAIATAVFPQGVCGPHLDALARRALWEAGLDYDHGTGHGVGSYLSVHEGPVSLSRAARMVPIAEGMILSDEPGFYWPGHYGIRLENLLLVQDAVLPGAQKPFLRFETLTLAPFDRRLLEPGLLSAAERDWLDAYHDRVLAEVGPALEGEDRAWLAAACRPLG
ncbi:MAG: aminopeptidase P family protein [Acetobacteraceae bacterium]|nr:aminopeptidase P family protein [Acetobacteraceae bacterium]